MLKKKKTVRHQKPSTKEKDINEPGCKRRMGQAAGEENGVSQPHNTPKAKRTKKEENGPKKQKKSPVSCRGEPAPDEWQGHGPGTSNWPSRKRPWKGTSRGSKWGTGDWQPPAPQQREDEEDAVYADFVDPDADEAELLRALQDITLKCKDCGAGFIFTARQQKWFIASGLENFPSRCVGCRREKQEFFADASGSSACFKCGEKGHWAQNCPNAASESANKCYRCGERGHFSRECPNHGSIHKSGRCCNCGQAGHRAFDCPHPKRKESICLDFVDGRCTWGSACRFAHELRAPPASLTT